MKDLKSDEFMTSFEKDNLENYNICKSPSYIVKKFENAIANEPIIESYLLHQDLISLTSNVRESASRKCSQRPFSSPCWMKDQVTTDQPVANKMHIYLVPTEIVSDKISTENINLGKPTRTTLLRNRMNWSDFLGGRTRMLRSAKRGCASCKTDDGVRPKTETSVTSSNAVNGAVNYAFMVGARYNCSRFTNHLSCDVKVPPKILLEDNSVGSIVSPHNLSYSHPNSPQSPQMSESKKKIYSIKDLRMQSEIENKEVVSSRQVCSDKAVGDEIPSVRPANQLKTPPTRNSLPSSTFRSKVLPVVIGEKCYTAESSNKNSDNSIPKTCWTKAIINRHFARQSRNMRNRRQAHPNSITQFQVTGISTSKLLHMQLQ